MRFIFLAALRQGTAMCYNGSTALRYSVETMTSMVADILWVLALFLLSAAMRHAIAIAGAKNT